MGFGYIPGQGSTQSATQTRDSLQTLTGVDRLDASAVKNIPSGGGLAAWQLKTNNYTAVDGDRIRAQLSIADQTIVCPINPAIGDEFEIQRLDATANSLIIDPNGQPFKGQASKDGLFNSGNIGLSERISYVDSTIGWLPQHDRLTYQDHVSPPLLGQLLLQLNFEGANNSTTFVDSSSFNRTVSAFGNAKLTTTTPIAGTSSGTFDANGTSYLSIPAATAFNFGNTGFSVRGQLKTTQLGGYKAVASYRQGGFVAGSWVIYNNSGVLEVWVADFNGSAAMLSAPGVNIANGLPHTFEWKRVANLFTLSVDGSILSSLTSGLSFTAVNFDLRIGRDGGSTTFDYAGLIDNLEIEIF